LTGRVRSRLIRVPVSVVGAFVLEGPDGGRVLVLPKTPGALPIVAEGLRAAVHGRVIALPPSADDLGGDRADDVVAIADLAARTDADALLRADGVAVRAA
jgi:hypothetical protein